MDREKVIELFSSCISKGGWNNCTNCEHGKAQAVLTCKPLAENVLKVLKEQNTVDHALEVLRQAGWKETQDVPFPAELLKEQEPIMIKTVMINGSGRNGRCKNCLMMLNEMDYPNFCGNCGQAVKWE